METADTKIEPEVIITSDGKEMKVHRYVNGKEVDKDFFKRTLITNPIFLDRLEKAHQRVMKCEIDKIKDQREATTDNSNSSEKV